MHHNIVYLNEFYSYNFIETISSFIQGWVADSIVKVLDSLGGVLSNADLAAHCSTFEDPISVTYRGHEIYEIPPNGQGKGSDEIQYIVSFFTNPYIIICIC